MIKIGITGTGMIGTAHVVGLAAYKPDGVEYVAACDNNKEKCDEFAGKYGLKAYYDLKDMLADESIDIVDVCVPSSMHEEFAVAAAKAGKHILVEKPIAFTMEAALNMYGAARENGVKIMVAQNLRCWPEYAKIKELIDGGSLGDIVTIYAARLGQMPTWADWYKNPNISGETLMNLTLHDIDFVHYLFGKPKSIYSAGSKDQYGCYNDVMNIIKFENGTNVLVDGSLSMTPGYPFTMHMRVLGTKGTLEFSYKAGENLDADNCKTSFLLYLPDEGGKEVEFDSYDAYGFEIKYFADCVRDGRDPEMVSEESILTVLNSILKAKESLYTGEVYAL